jgi:hypothetical protein
MRFHVVLANFETEIFTTPPTFHGTSIGNHDLKMALASCSTKWFFSPESGDINLHESLFFVVQNSFMNVEIGLYQNNHLNLRIQ